MFCDLTCLCCVFPGIKMCIVKAAFINLLYLLYWGAQVFWVKKIKLPAKFNAKVKAELELQNGQTRTFAYEIKIPLEHARHVTVFFRVRKLAILFWTIMLGMISKYKFDS